MDKYNIIAGNKTIKERCWILMVVLVPATLLLSMHYLSNFEVVQSTNFQPPPYKTWMTIPPTTMKADVSQVKVVENVKELFNGLMKADVSQIKVVENVKELFNGLMTEDEILTTKPCDDVQLLTSVTKTKVFIQGNKSNYVLNDRIKLTIIAYNNKGMPQKEGGDQFRATLRSDDKNAYGVGLVTDHDNGTYTVEFEAQWIGFPLIQIIMTYTRQAVVALVRSRLKILPETYTIARYQKNNNLFEDGYCHPDNKMLMYDEICTRETQVTKSVCIKEGLTPNRTQVCNFTSRNSGFPTYCLAPVSTNLKCEDWIFIRRRKSKYPSVGRTQCERIALSRLNQILTQRINVSIVPQTLNDTREIIDLPTTSCSHYNKTKLWLHKEPTGFFYRGKWHLRHCKGVDINNLVECMRNKRLYIIGDSTMRQWFENIMKRYECKKYTEVWTYSKWYRPSECYNSDINFTSIYAVHSLPFNVDGMVNASLYLKSISQRLDAIPNDENVIFVFHVFGHMSFYHPDHYRKKLTIIRDHVEKLLNRNKNAKIMFKSPHVFTQDRVIMGYIFNRIVYEVFGNLYDRVYYLNNRDSSSIFPVYSIHPVDTVVDAMVDQAFAYACD